MRETKVSADIEVKVETKEDNHIQVITEASQEKDVHEASPDITPGIVEIHSLKRLILRKELIMLLFL